MRIYFTAVLSLLFFVVSTQAEDKPDNNIPDIQAFMQGKTLVEGFHDLLIDSESGKTYLILEDQGSQFIFQTSLARGIGSNDIGLDRGELGATKLVSFHHAGEKVLMMQHNTRYRAISDNNSERQAIQEAFASSVIWGFKVVARSGDQLVIDYTEYLISDSYNIAATLKEQKQGDFKVDATRSAPYLPMTKNFVDNTELESIVTLVGKEAGDELKTVTPDETAITVHIHHSMIRLPKAGFVQREFHPESGFFPFTYKDYSAPIDEDINQRFIPRHRLEKGQSITYYMDPGVPEPVQSALMQGAVWWNDAFEAAGFKNAFKVKMLPDDADPMDVRYNIIQWVHRSTRGWSYGMSVRDPRTGEILKGKVSLGSLRIRQDLLIAQGLISPYKDKLDNDKASKEIKEVALARIRQLAAHEIGHTLGLAHNYSASTYGRGSVMDYPHPLLKLKRGKIDLSDAYDTGIGEWDKHSITYGYKLLDATEEQKILDEHIDSGRKQGLKFISDRDARAAGGAHPGAHLWDSGEDVILSLVEILAVRDVALNHLGKNSIPLGSPYSEIEDVLVPIYYLHRYQTEAVTKLIGGVQYDYSVKVDEDLEGIKPVATDVQHAALKAVLATFDPNTLSLPAELIKLLVPKPMGYQRDRENMPSNTLPIYDPVTPAEAAVEETLKFLLHPQRLARLAQQHAVDDDMVGIEFLYGQLVNNTIKAKPKQGLEGEIHKRINLLVVEHMLGILYGNLIVPEVTAQTLVSLNDLQVWLEKRSAADKQYLSYLIKQAKEKGEFKRRESVAKIPPGSPI
jgi:hypothetical protein